MKKTIRSLYERYCAHHDMDRPFLEWIGAIGFVAFPLLYILRRTNTVLAPLYDDFTLRVVASVLCLLMGLRRWWPAKLKPYYFGYSYITLFYCLSFLLSFTMLQNQGGTASVVNMFMGAILLILLADWRNTTVLLLSGYFLSIVIFFGVSPDPKIPAEFLIAAIGSIVVVLTGAVSHFAEKQAELKRMRQAYAALAGSIAHEMRNPLGQVKFSLDSIEHTLPSPTTQVGVQPLQFAHLNNLYKHLAQGQTAIKRGLQVISMTLKEVSGKPIDPQTFEYLEAGKLTQKAVEEYSFETDGERNKVSVQVHSDFTFKVNETVYIFILFNLIKNALYYFKLQPTATMIITVDQSTVTVRDTGPGVPPELLARLFSAFATSGKTEGTGLGLAYCKRAMQAFGGDITCTSEVGRYTEIILHFPVITQNEINTHEYEVLHEAKEIFKGKRILLVDDQAIIRTVTRSLLDGLDAQIDEAQDGQEALQQLRQAKYDLVIMDLNMPVLDGYAAAEKIRQGFVPTQKAIPIVAYTAESAYIAQVKTEKVGMNGFICKPCSRLELIKSLQNAIKNADKKTAVEASFNQMLSGKIIVVADDNKQNRKIVQTYLQQWNVKSIEAEHGMAVLEILDGDTPVDAILMDMQMPGMGGLQTTRVIRARNNQRHIPIIALTAHFSDAHKQEALEAGMEDFISKPIEMEELHEKLITVFSKQSVLSTGATANASAPLQSKPVSTKTPAAPGWPLEALSARNMTTADGVALFNVSRLESMRAIDDKFLQECLTVYTRQITEYFALIETHMNNKDFQAFHDILHKLLGNAAEAGFYALHQFIRHRVSPAVENNHQWPTEENWLETAKDLYAQTVIAVNKMVAA